MTLGAPKNAGVAAFRKVQGSKVGGAAINGVVKVNNMIKEHKQAKTFEKRKLNLHIKRQIRILL